MLAEITYNAGKSYRVKGHKFERGKTVKVKDSAVVRKCQQTVGFSVRVLEVERPVRKAKQRPIVKQPVKKVKKG